MVVNSKEVEDLLRRLTENLVSREIADSWAMMRMRAFDQHNLEFLPLEDEDRIWDALQYIALYSEKVDVGQYLFSAQDLRLFMSSGGWK